MCTYWQVYNTDDLYAAFEAANSLAGVATRIQLMQPGIYVMNITRVVSDAFGVNMICVEANPSIQVRSPRPQLEGLKWSQAGKGKCS